MEEPKIQKLNFLRGFFSGVFIELQGLPVVLKILVVVGYLAVLGQLLFTLLFEIAGNNLQTIEYSLSGENHIVPILVLVITGLAFILGWAYVLTGAAAARARVFLPVLAVFALQLFLVTAGNLLLLFMEFVFFSAVLVIYGLTFRTRFWLDLPGLHFFGWLGAISLIVILSVGISATSSDLAIALSANFSMLQLLTFFFWVLLGLSAMDLGISIGRGVTRFVRKRFPMTVFNSMIVFVLLVHPAIAFLVFWLTQDGFFLLDILFSILLVISALIVWVAHRWSASSGAVFLTLSLATPVVSLGVSMAFGGKDFTELLLRMTGIFPPTLLFVALTTYNLFGMGPTFTGVEGQVLPRRSRILLYFGTLLLVVAWMLFMSNNRSAETHRLSQDIQSWVNNLFALSAVFIGIPYTVWKAIKRREQLIGPEIEFSNPPGWPWLEQVPGSAWMVGAVIFACAFSCLLLVIIYFLV
jgi:hypothetical protein